MDVETEAPAAAAAAGAAVAAAGVSGVALTVQQINEFYEDHPESDPEDGDYEMGEVEEEDDVYPTGDETQDVHFVDDFDTLPSPHTISVEDLKYVLEEQEAKNNVGEYLSSVDLASEDFFPEVSCIQVNREYLPENSDVLGQRCISRKRYGTPLHYACHDPDGERGEQKIRIILETAKRFRVNPKLLLSVREGVCRSLRMEDKGLLETSELGSLDILEELGHEGREFVLEEGRGARTTPLFVLIENLNSTAGATRLICEASPKVVFAKSDTHETILHELCRRYIDLSSEKGQPCENTLNIIQVVLKSADKTMLGAKGLVQASAEREDGVDNFTHLQLQYGGWENEEQMEQYTPLHILCELKRIQASIGIYIFLRFFRCS